MLQFEFFHTFLLSVDVVFDRRNENQNKCMEKFKMDSRMDTFGKIFFTC